jgi:3-oxoacyl-[acyl-carrier protein] reductase
MAKSGKRARRLRSILVTGSGSGIGAAIARQLAGPGVGLVIHARANAKGAARVAQAARRAGAKAEVVLGDLAEPATTGQRLVEATVAAFGGLDVLVANAGFPLRGLIGDVRRAHLDHCFAVMAGSFFDMLAAAAPYLKRGRDPRVVAISSHNAHVFRTDYPVYPVSGPVKAALEAMVRAAAVQYAPDGITVNAVAPGLIRKEAGTPQILSAAEWAGYTAKIPLGRLGEPADVAALVGFLVSPAAAYITGQVVNVDGGFA